MNGLKRLHDWPTRLAAHFDAHRETVCVWGENDCFSLANDAVLAMTGIDPMAPGRGCYRTPIGAMRILRRHGIRDIPGYWTHILGDPLTTPKLAGRGDIAILDPAALSDADDVSIPVSAVVTLDGRHVAYLDGRGGLRFTPVSSAATAWRLG